ncbi:MAG TPA: hypothetical protein QGF35_03995 [Dehalococcoidia bacterium]|nr:hypothetical protein [Dehalococcoidia bacterium]
MVVHYIYFPQIKADMAESRHPTLARRPIALIRGVGGDAIVTARTSTAARLGVLVGMSAGSAQARAPRCAFLPDREDERMELLEEIAAAIARDGCGVADIGEDFVAVHAGTLVEVGRVVAAAHLDQLAPRVSWRIATGASVTDAREAAQTARRTRVVKFSEPVEVTLPLAG